ncbi:response regulator [Verrucomicrobiaceae bacterium R5-34]|uniref:Response regulator n=1 Tax=Oceaniferula flava TaxID=2800421 RepID=A0AAE2SCS9_9BACT|nr:response regulator [Oceaniferula flavus]MBK1831300.1 response regulator [Verrucomicrobiaceae bacterium R5-34]MBK1855469.1 response regulator [Oceaniferula flavus]MBM1136775.1 response regulator [Oceaniferula flavus]
MNENPKILLIDDEVDFTTLLAENLEASGYQVTQINDPREALETARNLQPDICIIDLVMPGMDGGDVVSAIRSDFMLAKTPVLMLTALVEENPDNPGGIQMNGGLPFVSKTSGLDDILKAIQAQLSD